MVAKNLHENQKGPFFQDAFSFTIFYPKRLTKVSRFFVRSMGLLHKASDGQGFASRCAQLETYGVRMRALSRTTCWLPAVRFLFKQIFAKQKCHARWQFCFAMSARQESNLRPSPFRPRRISLWLKKGAVILKFGA